MNPGAWRIRTAVPGRARGGKDRVAVLRAAFMVTMKGPQVVTDAGKMKLDLDAISGDDVQTPVAKIYAIPTGSFSAPSRRWKRSST